VTRAAWPHLVSAGSGRVLNLASGARALGVPGMTGYAAAKLGVVASPGRWPSKVRKHHIGVNVMAPCAKTRPGGSGRSQPRRRCTNGCPWTRSRRWRAWLVHEDCPVSGECFSVGGGYIGRVSVAVNEGWRGRPLTPESVRDHWRPFMADGPGRRSRPGAAIMDRMLDGFRP